MKSPSWTLSLTFSGDFLRLVALAAMLITAANSNCLASPTSDDVGHLLADGEADFVSRLLEQQLYEVAAQYCERSAVGTVDVEQQSAWELLLAECRLRQVWILSADSRTETIRLAIQRLSDFRTNHTPSPNQDLRLRLTQLELLGVAGLVEEILHTPISAKRKPVNAASLRGIEFALKAVEQGQTEADLLLNQIDRIRKELDPTFARLIRERIRLLSAQMLLTRSRLKPSPQDNDLLRKARTATERIAKSAADDSIRLRARGLLAELSLETDSSESFSLKLKALEESSASSADRMLVESLRVRSLLLKGRPSDALEASVKGEDVLFESSSELKVLRLQCLVQMYELVFELPDSDSTSTIKSGTEAEFRTLRERTLPGLKGIWRERALRLSERFDRLTQVGPQLADAFEDVTSLVQSGDSAAAIQRLENIAKNLAPTQSALRSAVLMEMGQLAIVSSQWTVAEHAFRDASASFTEAGRTSEAAAADLLRVFAIGQRWESMRPFAAAVSKERSDETKALEVTYREALDKHLQTYASERSAARAREWRARLLVAVDPLAAAADLLNATDLTLDQNSSSKDRQMVQERLCLAGECLIDVQRHADSMPAEQRLTFQQLITSMRQNPLATSPQVESNDPLSACIAATLLALRIAEPSRDANAWQTLASESRATLDQLSRNSIAVDNSATNQGSNQPQAGTRTTSDHQRFLKKARLYCHLILITAAFRNLEGEDGLLASKNAILEEPANDQVRWIQQLSMQLGKPDDAIPGDSQLAAFLSQLLSTSGSERVKLSKAAEIEVLRVQARLAPHSKNWTLFGEQLRWLMNRELSDEEMMQLSNMLSELSAANTADALPKRPFDADAVEFWRLAQKRMKRGHEVWLEASLSLSEAAFATGDIKESRRIIGVVSVIYPDWGTPSRKARADKLQMLLPNEEGKPR